eukprot:15452488-Alexandrium_andersonii.AAC.1
MQQQHHYHQHHHHHRRRRRRRRHGKHRQIGTNISRITTAITSTSMLGAKKFRAMISGAPGRLRP